MDEFEWFSTILHVTGHLRGRNVGGSWLSVVMSNTAAFPNPAGTPACASGGIPAVADAAAHVIVDDARQALSRLADINPRALSADALLRFTAALESLTRLIDVNHIAVAAEITARSPRTAGFDGLAARHGCATGAQLIEQVTGASSRTARQRVRVAAQTAQRTSDTGLPLPALFPATQAALAGGVIGIDAADAITATLKTLPTTIPVEAVEWAETTLVNNAIGTDQTPPVCADLIRAQAATFRDRLDADGIEPRDDRLVAKRGIRFFREADGTLGVSGNLPPAQEAIVVPVFDAFLSPRTAPAFLATDEDAAHDGDEHGAMRDPRTREQQRADILTALCEVAARTGQTPQLQGAAPTVLAVVHQHDLETGTGFGVAVGTDQPLPISMIQQIACDGGIQQVSLDADGRVLELFSKARFFTPVAAQGDDRPRRTHLRQPGCTIPAYWAEAHHIIPDSAGGPTTVDNGCLLCWFDHRLVERGEFTVKMVDGKPVFSPPDWYTKREYLKPHRRE